VEPNSSTRDLGGTAMASCVLIASTTSIEVMA